MVSNHTIHDTKPHGPLSVSEIITLSSNIGAIKMGNEVGYSLFCDYLHRFGFGNKTAIDLLGEREGYIRPAHQAKPLDQATLYFGQGMSGTSIQLAAAIAAIANDGKLMRPFILKKVTDPYGRVVRETYPYMVRRAVSPQIARKVREILEGVVSEEGTAPSAAIQGFTVGGKTGTSQKVDSLTGGYSRSKYVAIFVGFVPVDRPKLVILVMIDEPKGVTYGGLVAGPVFSRVGKWSLNYLRVNPQFRMADASDGNHATVPEGPLEAEQHPETGVPGVLPDFRGESMREVLSKGRTLGLQMVVEGTGLVVRQSPAPGVSLDQVETVRISFKPPI
jgi:cell division protein FtsI (penicillin-binding protein 3)